MADPIRELFSQTSWDADGVTTVWNFSFAGPENVPYLSRDHVFASKLNKATGVVTQIPIAPGDWIGPSTISIVPAVEVGYELTIYRNTPKDKPLVEFQDKASITEASLDRNARQAVFVAAESADGLNVAIDSVSQIVNYVGVAQAAAVSATASELAAADSAIDAANSAGDAADSATNAASSATVSTNQAANAMASATSANTSATNAANSASAAKTSATNAAASAADAATSATNAGDSVEAAASSATAASTHATNAGDSATAAANSASAAADSETSASDSATTATTQADVATTKAAEAAASAASIAGGPVAKWAELTGIITQAQAEAALTNLATKAELNNWQTTPVTTAGITLGLGTVAGRWRWRRQGRKVEYHLSLYINTITATSKFPIQLVTPTPVAADDGGRVGGANATVWTGSGRESESLGYGLIGWVRQNTSLYNIAALTDAVPGAGHRLNLSGFYETDEP